jgi:hypothetical protein
MRMALEKDDLEIELNKIKENIERRWLKWNL